MTSNIRMTSHTTSLLVCFSAFVTCTIPSKLAFLSNQIFPSSPPFALNFRMPPSRSSAFLYRFILFEPPISFTITQHFVQNHPSSLSSLAAEISAQQPLVSAHLTTPRHKARCNNQHFRLGLHDYRENIILRFQVETR